MHKHQCHNELKQKKNKEKKLEKMAVHAFPIVLKKNSQVYLGS